jgi:hypothetical protein
VELQRVLVALAVIHQMAQAALVFKAASLARQLTMLAAAVAAVQTSTAQHMLAA